MFSEIYTDLSTTVGNVVTNTDNVWVLVIIGVIALANGLSMSSWTDIWGRAALALIAFALILFLWDALDNENRFEWANWNSEGIESWRELMALTVRTMLGYYIVMWIGIMLVHIVKSVVQR